MTVDGRHSSPFSLEARLKSSSPAAWLGQRLLLLLCIQDPLGPQLEMLCCHTRPVQELPGEEDVYETHPQEPAGSVPVLQHSCREGVCVNTASRPGAVSRKPLDGSDSHCCPEVGVRMIKLGSLCHTSHVFQISLNTWSVKTVALSKVNFSATL